MAFWIVAAALGVAVTALLLAALMRGHVASEPAAAYDLRVYRDQLREIDRDLARGAVAGPEAERMRTEVSRRVLEADRALSAQAAADQAPRTATLAVAGLLAVVMAGGGWLYLRIGAPGYPDLPLATRIEMADALRRDRPRQAEAEAAAPAPATAEADPGFLGLMDKLRTALKDRPDDLAGFELLARNEAALGNFAAAGVAQRRVLELKGDGASAADHVALAESMILAAGGYVSPEAEAELMSALRLDPLDGTATFYAGLMFAQIGRPDRTFAFWAPLLDRSAPDDPWVAPIRAQIEAVAAEAGQINYVLPPAPGAVGPSAQDVQAAAGMAPEERQAMIEGMVGQLSDRLAAQGGPAEDWARLIASYGVLGRTEEARAIWTEAQATFAGREADLAVIRAAAETAGVAE